MYRLFYRDFIRYKFFNSLFLGLSVGALFIVYAPLPPVIYSLGGIALALATIAVAKIYTKIITLRWFYRISMGVELIVFTVLLLFLLLAYGYAAALIVYIGYQATFAFGAYLVRAETLFLRRKELLSLVDIAKQKGYLAGMVLSYLFYTLLSSFIDDDKQTQVYYMHFLLLLAEGVTIYYLKRAFRRVATR